MLELDNEFALFGGKGVACQPNARTAHRLERFAKAHRGALSRGGRIVQLMRQTGGELSQRHQLVALRLHFGGFANAVRHHRHEALAQLRDSVQHLRKVTLVEHGDPGGKHGL